MANRMKSMGTTHETAIVKWLKENGWPWARRRTMKGARDEGDVCLSERIPFTIEAKNQRGASERSTLVAWVKELEAEVEAVGDMAGAVIVKRRGTTDVGEYLAVMPVKYLNLLLKDVFTSEEGVARRRVVPRYRSS